MINLGQVQGWELKGDNFITQIMDRDKSNSLKNAQIVTRFPPEPNGYLHIGHAKSLTLNFGLAARYQGRCNLRFDDTNPSQENDDYVRAIIEDVKWFVGHDKFDIIWASDYFEIMHKKAVELIEQGKAFVDLCSPDEIAKMRGAPTHPGIPSPYRDTSISENLKLFEQMTNGHFDEGAAVLRAKIDMTSPNTNLRDPVLYRIKKEPHHRTKDRWVVYPLYDWAHGWEDSLEGITHSLCTLEFENHRPLYDWFLDQFPTAHHPRQYEFNRLTISNTVLSKRKLNQLVTEKHVQDWDDPRMATLRGLRRRGYTPSSLRLFCEAVGVSKTEGIVEPAMLEFYIREELNRTALRTMVVFDPIKITITNYPHNQTEEIDVENNPEDPQSGTRKVLFSGELWVDGEDFSETPPKGWYRLAVGSEVRLKGAYFFTCKEVIKDAQGKVIQLKGEYDEKSRGGVSPDGRKVKGTIQWVSTAHALPMEVRLYNHLLTVDNISSIPEDADWKDYINPESLVVVNPAYGEKALESAKEGVAYQFMRKGYFVKDIKDSTPDHCVFNRTVTLKDTWTKKTN